MVCAWLLRAAVSSLCAADLRCFWRFSAPSVFAAAAFVPFERFLYRPFKKIPALEPGFSCGENCLRRSRGSSGGLGRDADDFLLGLSLGGERHLAANERKKRVILSHSDVDPGVN